MTSALPLAVGGGGAGDLKSISFPTYFAYLVPGLIYYDNQLGR